MATSGFLRLRDDSIDEYEVWNYVRARCVFLLLIATILWNFTIDKSKPLSSRATIIGAALLKYAITHHGQFPPGKTSTEVFAHLVDDKDAKPAVFWFPIAGKSKPVNKGLRPENVCFDLTYGTDSQSPDWVPFVYPTGYRIDYSSGIAYRLPSFAIKERVICFSYFGTVRYFPVGKSYFFGWLVFPFDQINVMPDKPFDAAVSHFKQLTPDGGF
jgi:hypothetical protein